MATPKRFHYDKPEYLRLTDASKVFPFGEDKLKEIALKIGALRKVDKCVLVNYQMMKDFMESCIYIDEK